MSLSKNSVPRPLPYGWAFPLLVAAVLVIVPLAALGQYDQRQLILIGIYTLVVSGLNLSLGYGGELALGQVAMFAAGAYVTGILAQHGVTELTVAVLAGMVAAAVVGLISGAAGLRLSRWSLAIVSFFLVLLIPVVITMTEGVTGGLLGLSGISGPTLLGIPVGFTGFYVTALMVALIWLVLMRNLVLSRHGVSFRVMRESPALASSLGLPTYRLRMRVYVLGSVPAGAAGAIYAYLNGFISPDAFNLNLGITILAASVVGGSNSIYGAFAGAALLVLGPLQASGFELYSTVVYGIFLIVVGVLFRGGLAELFRILWAWVLRRLGRSRQDEQHDTPVAAVGSGASGGLRIPGQRIRTRGLSRSFGGIRALDEVDFVAEPGTITAVIGPNGAGKTTLLNAISGFVRPEAGEIEVGDTTVSGLSPYQVARSGVSRTFQTPVIPEDMTVREIAESGRLWVRGPGTLATMLRLPSAWRIRRQDHLAGQQALEFAGLTGIADRTAGKLPLGVRRLLEVVRAVAAAPGVILLDEPAAGLDEDGLAELSRLMLRARDAGATVVIVEHNVRFVFDLAEKICVMRLGRMIAAGTPEEVASDPEVISSYLGARASTLLERSVPES
ncbi:ATP-binding cassette domain-containing protein [Nakamurella sp. YIM 132087]|uniref:ATP-binding cassette domain-containing protein n=1 Tax=Nakamurella alba TaxID=2665158 RepID=A0A7K1FQG7_9ACTN|nr:branched-chain amino acid ABC transporter ATP-binding protein/permease [Nakamurella alba]MTD16320.1 ATP-binding cassette domain-containing protein [Nakamurella alba]